MSPISKFTAIESARGGSSFSSNIQTLRKSPSVRSRWKSLFLLTSLVIVTPASGLSMSTRSPPVQRTESSITEYTNRRVPTLRSIASSISSFSDYDVDQDNQLVRTNDLAMGDLSFEQFGVNAEVVSVVDIGKALIIQINLTGRHE